MASNETILEIKNISKTFPGVKALQNVNFDLKRGEVHALVGENGAGKSTLIKILAGVYRPDKGGEIKLGWTDTAITDPIASIRAGISVIYQDISLFPNLSIEENICIGNVKGAFINRTEQRRIAQDALRILGIEVNPSTMLGDVSIGVQQLVAIAKAVHFDAKVIIMDEPTASLSSAEVNRLYEIVEKLRERGITILYISHKLEEVFRLADRITVLRDGHCIGTYPKSSLSEEELVSKMVGRHLEIDDRKKGKTDGDVILELKGLSRNKEYEDCSFMLKAGEVVGVTGLVGAGRSELFQSVFGISRPDCGEILLHGKPATIFSPKNAIKQGIVYLPENRLLQGIIPKQSMKANLTVTIMAQICNNLGFFKKESEQQICNDYISSLDIRPPLPEMRIENMSGGNQQKVVLGKWLATNPSVFIADEPTAGVDIGAKAEIHRIIRKLAENGMGVIVISSELPEILAVSDRIVIMKKGHIVGEMDANEATQEKIMAQAL